MKNLIIFLYLCCCCHILVAQDYFSRTYDPFNHGPELLKDIQLVDEQLRITAIGFCTDQRCLGQLILDQQGNLVSADTILPGFDPGFFPVYTDSTFTTAGFDTPIDSKYMLYQSNLDGDSLGLIDLQISGDRYHHYFNKGMIEYNNQYVVYGQVTDREDLWEEQEKVKGLLFWVNKDLTLDTITFIEPPERWLLLYEAQIDPQNQLTFIYQYTKRHPISQLNLYYKALIKLNEERQVVFNRESTSSDNTQSNLAILDDGTMVTDFNGSRGTEEILAIAPDGELKWTYTFDNLLGFASHGVLDLGIAANGDIIGCGLMSSAKFDYGESGYIFRLSPQGELLWERIYLLEPDTDPELPENWPLLSYLFQIIELPNGGLVAGGEVLRPYNDPVQGPRSDQDVWIIRTDAEGCMQEDCGFEQLITDVEEVTLSSLAQPLIYPNPTRDILHIDTPHSPDAYQLLDSNGRMLQSGAFQPSISLQPWPPGIYLLRLIREQSVATFKVLKQ